MILNRLKNWIRLKANPESISDRGEKSNFRRGMYPQILFLYNTILSVPFFYKIYCFPKVAWLLKTLFVCVFTFVDPCIFNIYICLLVFVEFVKHFLIE